MKKICILLSISAYELLFDITPDNNLEAIASRLRKLSPNQFEVANDIISKLLEAFSTK